MVKIKKPEIGDHREIRGIDFICKGFDADGKPQWRKADKIEKAHQDGERHPKNPKLIWVSSAAGGKGDWRTDPNLRGKKANAGGGGGGAAAPASGGGASASGQESGGGEDNGGNQQNQPQPAQPKQKFKYTLSAYITDSDETRKQAVAYVTTIVSLKNIREDNEESQ